MNIKQIDFIQEDITSALQGQVERLAPLKNKAVFISGASGFIGKWVIEMINQLNSEHGFGVSIHASSRSIQEQARLAPEVFNKKHLRLIQADGKSLGEIDPEVSYVLHLAGTPDNRDHASDPVRVMNDIFAGTNKILQASMRLDKLVSFTHMSSGLVSGPQPLDVEKVREEDFYPLSCSSLNSVYPEAKRAAEALAQGYRSIYKIPLTILRPFAFIGPYQSIERPWAINNFIRDSLQGQPIRILGDQETVRSYMYPSEMAFWTLLAVVNPRPGSIYNLGSSDGKSLGTVAKIVERSFEGQNGIVSTVAPGTGLRTKFVPSTQKFETDFKVTRSLSTQESIERSIKWYRLGL